MPKKKKQAAVVDSEPEPPKPWCYYCNKKFANEGVLMQHQREKHFKCSRCWKTLLSATGLKNHSHTRHQLIIHEVPNAVEGRTGFELEISGMRGVPQELLSEEEKAYYGIAEPELELPSAYMPVAGAADPYAGMMQHAAAYGAVPHMMAHPAGYPGAYAYAPQAPGWGGMPMAGMGMPGMHAHAPYPPPPGDMHGAGPPPAWQQPMPGMPPPPMAMGGPPPAPMPPPVPAAADVVSTSLPPPPPPPPAAADVVSTSLPPPPPPPAAADIPVPSAPPAAPVALPPPAEPAPAPAPAPRKRRSRFDEQPEDAAGGAVAPPPPPPPPPLAQ